MGDAFGSKMEESVLKRKGKVRKEDQEVFKTHNDSSKSMELIGKTWRKSGLELFKSDINGFNLSGRSWDRKYSDREGGEWETKDLKRGSIRDDIKFLLRKLSQMHHSNHENLIVIHDEPADDYRNINWNEIKDVMKSNYVVTMNDINSPSEF